MVKIRVGGGDLLDAKAAGDGEIKRVNGEQTVLALEFEREVVVFDFHGFHLQAAAQKVAGFTGVLRELLDEPLVLAEGAGGDAPAAAAEAVAAAAWRRNRVMTVALLIVLLYPTVNRWGYPMGRKFLRIRR